MAVVDDETRPPPRRRGRPAEHGFGHVIVLALVAVIAILVVAAIADARNQAQQPDPGAIATAIGPAIASINADGPAGAAVGSGVVIAADQVVTAAHVVDTADAITVATTSTKPARAHVVGYDRAADIALLALDDANTSPFQPAPVDATVTMRVGDTVVALGNPTAVAAPVASAGRVRALDATAITVDVPVRADEIGGAIVDSARNVVGMVAATPTVTTTTARPWSAVMSVVDTIDRRRTTSDVHVGPRASLGVVVGALPGSAGARVSSVDAHAPAAAIHPGDVVARVAGVSVSTVADIERALDPYAPGDAVPVDVFDTRGVLRTVSVRLTAA